MAEKKTGCGCGCALKQETIKAPKGNEKAKEVKESK
jgi:hypothetical protein